MGNALEGCLNKWSNIIDYYLTHNDVLFFFHPHFIGTLDAELGQASFSAWSC